MLYLPDSAQAVSTPVDVWWEDLIRREEGIDNKRGEEVITYTNMTHTNRQAWNTIK